MPTEKRRFTIHSSDVKLPSDYSGVFESSTPSGAAKKAIAQIYRKTKSTKKTIHFTLRQSSLGKNHNSEYSYVGSKIIFKKPVDTGRKDAKGEPILAKYEYKVKADKAKPVKKEAKKEKKPASPKKCPEGKVRNPATGRCKKVAASPKKKSKKVARRSVSGREYGDI